MAACRQPPAVLWFMASTKSLRKHRFPFQNGHGWNRPFPVGKPGSLHGPFIPVFSSLDIRHTSQKRPLPAIEDTSGIDMVLRRRLLVALKP